MLAQWFTFAMCLATPKWCNQAYVVVSETIEKECRDSIVDAADYWIRAGVNYITLYDVPPDALRPDKQVPDLIQVFQTNLPPNVLGETRTSYTVTGCIKAARIQLTSCNVNVVIHEMGHAFGLQHSDDPTNIMFPDDTDGMGLSLAQVEHVR